MLQAKVMEQELRKKAPRLQALTDLTLLPDHSVKTSRARSNASRTCSNIRTAKASDSDVEEKDCVMLAPSWVSFINCPCDLFVCFTNCIYIFKEEKHANSSTPTFFYIFHPKECIEQPYLHDAPIERVLFCYLFCCCSRFVFEKNSDYRAQSDSFLCYSLAPGWQQLRLFIASAPRCQDEPVEDEVAIKWPTNVLNMLEFLKVAG